MEKSLNEWLELLETKHNKKIDLGLDRIKQVFTNLNLNTNASTVITVGGTNGKGSTVSMLSSICQQAGYTVGKFTSPHIQKYNERIQINDTNVSDKEIIQAFKLIDRNLSDVTLSYFEYSTLAALIIFKNNNVDVILLEVGLGGRLDSVNVVDTDCAIITTIDIDHTEWLGDNRESIGFEKAGIMRGNTPVIFGDKNCPQSIIEHAKNIKADLYFVSEELLVPDLNVKGLYQIKNAKTAVTALKTLDNKLNITDVAIANGLKNIKLEGRLQTISYNPEVILDVAHNQQAGESLAKWIEDNPIKGKTFAVFAVLTDKKPLQWLTCFKGIIDVWCISQVNSNRSMSSTELLKILSESKIADLTCKFNTVNNAFNAAKIMAQPEDRIIVFGSFYTVSEVRH